MFTLPFDILVLMLLHVFASESQLNASLKKIYKKNLIGISQYQKPFEFGFLTMLRKIWHCFAMSATFMRQFIFLT